MRWPHLSLHDASMWWLSPFASSHPTCPHPRPLQHCRSRQAQREAATSTPTSPTSMTRYSSGASPQFFGLSSPLVVVDTPPNLIRCIMDIRTPSWPSSITSTLPHFADHTARRFPLVASHTDSRTRTTTDEPCSAHTSHTLCTLYTWSRV